MMFMSDYNKIVNEHFDLSDNYTRRFIASLEESGQEQLIAALSSALYDKIVAKVDEIDFGTIPQSRGDITKVQGFANTEECLRIIRKLVIEYNQKTDIVDAIITAISNIRERKNIFVKAFNVKADMPCMIYNLMVLAIERSVSLIIATCIQFVKDPSSKTVKSSLDKVAYEKTMDDMLYKQLTSFNALCKTGAMDQTLNNTMKVNTVHEEFDVVGSVLGREENGEIGDGSDVPVNGDVQPFGPDNSAEPFGSSEAEPANEEPVSVPEDNKDDDTKFDVYNPENKPELNPATPPVPIEEPEGATVTFDDNGIDPQKDYQGMPGTIVARMAKLIFPGKPEEDDERKGCPIGAPGEPGDPGIPAAPQDGVEAENIPDVVPTDDADGTMDEPITEDEIQEGVLGDVAKAVGKATKDTVMNNKDAIASILSKGKKIGKAALIVAGIAALPFAIVKIIIPFIRTMVYYFYYTKMKVSDYLEIQAELIEANANELENSTDSDMTEEQKAKVAEKQRKFADKLRKWSNIFSIDHKQASNNAKKEAEKDSKDKKTVKKDDDGDDSIF